MIYGGRLSIWYLPKEWPLPSPFPCYMVVFYLQESIGAAHIREPYEAVHFSCICRDSP